MVEEKTDWASRLNERVRIEQRVTATDEFGGQEVSWETLATVWAEVQPVSSGSRERMQAGKPLAIAGYRVRLRKRDGISADARLVWNERPLLIHSLHEQAGIFDILTYEEGL